ncbi:MAG: hypothetical protein K8I00_00135, partial [Candidatus Omnitrophica bacterium]|nr:hypothetical protein [Candidatus Omnitrophota bacterium]
RQWVAQYWGMDTSETFDLTFISEGDMLAATGGGVYRWDFAKLADDELRGVPNATGVSEYTRFKARFDSEPGIAEIHRWAIAYADVHPDKILTWRRQARARAWIPQLDIGIDGGRGWSRSDSLWGSSSSGGTHYIGPDDKSASRDMNWDVSLSWDLADVIWSTDQTTIDSRAKLMVELREDILNQVTRLYFERRRLQIELLSTITDFSTAVDHQLRIEELTALLDGLTGGVFSRQVKDALTIRQEKD